MTLNKPFAAALAAVALTTIPQKVEAIPYQLNVTGNAGSTPTSLVVNFETAAADLAPHPQAGVYNTLGATLTFGSTTYNYASGQLTILDNLSSDQFLLNFSDSSSTFQAMFDDPTGLSWSSTGMQMALDNLNGRNILMDLVGNNGEFHWQGVAEAGATGGGEPPVGVPDGGSTAALLGVGLLGLAAARKKFAGPSLG